MASLSVNNSREESVDITPPPDLRYQQPGMHFTPLLFHRTRGRNVRLSNDRCIATRCDTEFCQGYVFTARPIQLGERILIQVGVDMCILYLFHSFFWLCL